jgi:hypothetical protein
MRNEKQEPAQGLPDAGDERRAAVGFSCADWYILLMNRVILLASAVVLFCSSLYSSTELEGRISVEKGKPPVLESHGNSISLSSDDPMTAGTIQDPRISGKKLRVIGSYRRDGSFQVTDFYVVHPDGLCRIIYYCQVCHITAFSPGKCICCQQPTELEEVPLTDPRVHHEEVK